MATTTLTPSQENYLQWIYRLSGEGEVTVKALAERISLKMPSISRALKSLAELGLVDHQAYGGIRLSPNGETVAEALERRHRCLRQLLVDILGASPHSAEPEIDRLEHVLSDDLLTRLETLVEFAGSSEAWVRRLQLRIPESGEHTPFDIRIGETRLHAGTPSDIKNKS